MQSPIRAILLLVFIAVPLMEIALLIKIGQAIGFWATILIVIGTAALGTWLLHSQGMETLRRVLTSMDEGKPPVTPVLEGFVLLVAGLLLLTPGVLTDTLGFILLIPPVRQLIVRFGLNKFVFVTVGGRSWSADGRNAGPNQEPGGSEPWNETWTETRSETWAESEAAARGRPGPRPARPSASEGPIIEGEYERLEERTVDPRRGKS